MDSLYELKIENIEEDLLITFKNKTFTADDVSKALIDAFAYESEGYDDIDSIIFDEIKNNNGFIKYFWNTIPIEEKWSITDHIRISSDFKITFDWLDFEYLDVAEGILARYLIDEFNLKHAEDNCWFSKIELVNQAIHFYHHEIKNKKVSVYRKCLSEAMMKIIFDNIELEFHKSKLATQGDSFYEAVYVPLCVDGICDIDRDNDNSFYKEISKIIKNSVENVLK
jgi:hypothetical protein